MEYCKHIVNYNLSWNHSILNPEKWVCSVCGTTESVWACLSCTNVACGRFNEEHALKHYKESEHPLCMEVNEKYVYCYVCDDYVMNDNVAGDLKILRSALSAIATQTFTDIESRGKRLLRSYSHTGILSRSTAEEDDKLATASCHRKLVVLNKVFAAWKQLVAQKKQVVQTPPRASQSTVPPSPSTPALRKRTIVPGITGLRNLGNTCYMNSVLQVLSHLEEFRDLILSLKYSGYISPSGVRSPESGSQRTPCKQYLRQTTMEYFEHLVSPSTPSNRKGGGLSGGSTPKTPIKWQDLSDSPSLHSSKQSSTISLCEELHGLFRVLWSGKWAQVSPHAFLQAVWKKIPVFKGHSQHDAQEFLCELLDKVDQELEYAVERNFEIESEIKHSLQNLFQGELVSEVTCLSCGFKSSRYEPFTDLSLEFPKRFQRASDEVSSPRNTCHITEMLATFTETEKLDGKIYCCERCNSKRRRSCNPVYTNAMKQFLIKKLPQILKLHLKRFRWCGRNNREKIGTHVKFDEEIKLKPFCTEDNLEDAASTYRLCAVVMHHGRGFGSGHYTAYCRNRTAGSWVHCNDSRLQLTQLDDVLQAQAYILVFVKHVDSFGSPSDLLELLGTSRLSDEISPVSESSVSNLSMNSVNNDTPFIKKRNLQSRSRKKLLTAQKNVDSAERQSSRFSVRTKKYSGKSLISKELFLNQTPAAANSSKVKSRATPIYNSRRIALFRSPHSYFLRKRPCSFITVDSEIKLKRRRTTFW